MAGQTEEKTYLFADSGLAPTFNEDVARHYADMVMRLAITKTASTSDADDIFQEVFLKLAMCEKEFESEEHRKAWIIRVTLNCCNSHFTAPWRKNVTSFDDLLENELAVEEDDEHLSHEERNAIYKRILALPQNMKEVILLYYYEEMSIRQIAELLGTTEVNIKKRLSRARQKLKLVLEKDEFGR